MNYYTAKNLHKKNSIIWDFIGLDELASVIFVFVISICRPEIHVSSEFLIPLNSVYVPLLIRGLFLIPLAAFFLVLFIVPNKMKC